MKKPMASRFALFFVAAVALPVCSIAQNSPQTAPAAAAVPTASQRELATKLVALQRGPEMERMAFQLTGSAVQPVIAKWAPKLENMPKADQEKARDQLNTELKTLGDSTRKIIETQMDKSADSTLLPAYIERFSEAEMKQLVTLFESPAFKKYQTAAPELGNVWIKDVVDNSRTVVDEKTKAFDVIAAKIVGEKAGHDKAVAEKPVAKKK